MFALILAASMLVEIGDIPPVDTSFVRYARAHGLAKSFVYTAEHPGDWKSFGLVYDSLFVWQPGMTLAKDCGQDTVYADVIMAMGEPLENQIVRLDGRWTILRTKGLWRRPYGNRRATIIFARFPKCKEKP